jgi:hypothetical protein
MDAKQRATDALIEKYNEQLRLIPADALPVLVYGFNPAAWLLYRVDPEGDCVAGDEYVADSPDSRERAVSGRLGE